MEFEVRDEDGKIAPETEELVKLKRDFYKNGQWRGHIDGSTWPGPVLEPPGGDREWVGPLPDDATVLKPGGQVSFSGWPSKYYDMSRPGKYSITAKVCSDEPTREWFYSNEIHVTVLPKQPTQ